MNEITERNCLEAELVLGYKYYTIKQEYAQKAALCEREVALARNRQYADRLAYTTRRDNEVGTTAYLRTKHPEWEVEYNDYCQKEKDKAQRKDVEDYTKRQKEFINGEKSLCLICGVLCAVFLFLVVLFNILGVKEFNGDYAKAFQESGWLIAATFMGFIAVALAVGFVKARTAYLQAEKELKNYVSNKQANVVSMEEFFAQKTKNQGLKEELKAIYDAEHKAEIVSFEEKEKRIQAEITNKNLELLSIREIQAKLQEQGEALPKKLNVIPAYYFKEEAVEKMLFFYVNKRGDNIRDLINLYETTVFQEAVLKSLKDIAVSVDKLADTVRGSFNRLGLQLGIINESIRENTVAQRLNWEKLSEIKDDNARHYIEMVSAIEDIELLSNTYVTTNVTTEVNL